MEYYIFIAAVFLLCLGIFILPLTEACGLFFLLSSFSVTKWANPIHEIMPFSFMWIFFILYIIVLGLRFKINLISVLTSAPEYFKLYFILLFFGIFAITGALFSPEPDTTIKRSLGYIFNAIFFFSFLPIALMNTKSFNINKIILYICISFLIPIATGLFMFIFNSGEVTYMQGHFMRFTGVYGESSEGLSGNPNAAGYNSFILIGISIIGLLISTNISGKIMYFFTAAAGVFSLAASASRTGVLALGIFIAILSIMKGKTTVKYFSIAFILILLLTSLGFFNFIQETIDFESIPVIGRFIEFDTGGRAQLWGEGMSIFNGIQFLTGIGLGSITSIQFWSFSASKMQNIYLELFIETGLIGIILFLSFIVSGAVLIIRRWRESGLNGKNLWTGIAAFYFALCSYGLSESLLTPPNPSFHLLLLCILLTYQPLIVKNIYTQTQ